MKLREKIRTFLLIRQIRKQVRQIRKENYSMEPFKAIFGWLLKSKWARGHRRQISIGLTVATAALTLAGGPLAAVVPALANPAINPILLSLAAYFGIVGETFKNDEAK